MYSGGVGVGMLGSSVVVGPGVGVAAGMRIICPTWIRFGFRSGFIIWICSIVTLYELAMSMSVSPSCTWWTSGGIGVGVGMDVGVKVGVRVGVAVEVRVETVMRVGVVVLFSSSGSLVINL